MIQLQFLNYLLDSKDTSIITLNCLDKRYFKNYTNEWLFIENHLKEYGNIPDKATFCSKFKDFELLTVEESPTYLISELFKEYQTNQLVYAFNKVAESLNEGETDKAVDIFKNAYDKLSTGIALNCVDITKDTSRCNDYEERTENFDKYYVSTGFKELDAIIGGWDREEELATIIARPGVGKSWTLIKVALAAVEQGLNAGLYSGEMSEKKVGYRFDTLSQHIANGSLIHGNSDVKMDYLKYMSELPTKYKGSLKVLTPKMINGPAGVSALRAFIEKENLDILFIDQHSLLSDDNKATNPVERAANISRDLKNLQTLKKIPIISVSQMNRTKNDDKDSELIDLTQIAQADRIGQDSTVVIGISRDKKDKDLMKLHLVKSRDNENGKVLSYIVNLNKGMFTFVPEEINDSKEQQSLKNRYEENVTEDPFE